MLLEAAASGVSVVATDVGGTREIFPPGAALLVLPNDATALAMAVGKLLDDRVQRQQFATAALDRARRCFDASIAAAELARHYLAALARPAAPRTG